MTILSSCRQKVWSSRNKEVTTRSTGLVFPHGWWMTFSGVSHSLEQFNVGLPDVIKKLPSLFKGQPLLGNFLTTNVSNTESFFTATSLPPWVWALTGTRTGYNARQKGSETPFPSCSRWGSSGSGYGNHWQSDPQPVLWVIRGPVLPP